MKDGYYEQVWVEIKDAWWHELYYFHIDISSNKIVFKYSNEMAKKIIMTDDIVNLLMPFIRHSCFEKYRDNNIISENMLVLDAWYWHLKAKSGCKIPLLKLSNDQLESLMCPIPVEIENLLSVVKEIFDSKRKKRKKLK
ncbi:hypothetical protein [Clostridium sp. C8-1-8]|uniref:hypothetical protein n=1 Tax=Clostridium sp. C8-1-8 TaxID=2698831 RepID=UPI00136DA4DC|nr:hypothetical protein [Clostridium sp. C8-1-8]